VESERKKRFWKQIITVNDLNEKKVSFDFGDLAQVHEIKLQKFVSLLFLKLKRITWNQTYRYRHNVKRLGIVLARIPSPHSLNYSLVANKKKLKEI